MTHPPITPIIVQLDEREPHETFTDVAHEECIVRLRYVTERPYRAVDLTERYPDGMPIVHFDGHNVESILLRPRSLDAFYAGLHFVDALTARGNAVPSLVLPLVPGSRQDRLNPTGDYLFTVRSIARDLNARHFPQVHILDPHSDVTPALIDNVQVHDIVLPMSSRNGKYDAVIAPDGGAEKRASKVAQSLGLPLIHGWKKRNVKTGSLTGFGIEEAYEQFEHGLVVDDLCDGGGTFVGLAKAIRVGREADEPVDLDLYVTHGLFTKGTDELLQHFDRIFTTDSTLGNKIGTGVTMIPRCQALLNR